MIFPTYGSVFACILLSSVFMIVVCLLGNRINFILKNSANGCGESAGDFHDHGYAKNVFSM